MNIELELLKEHSKANSARIGDYIIENSEELKTLVSLFLSRKKVVSQRSGMVISYVHDLSPEIFNIELKEEIIKTLIHEDNIEVAVKRNIVRILQTMQIPIKYHSLIFNNALELMINPKEAIAVRAFCMQILYNLTSIYPELKLELILSLENILLLNNEAGIQSRGRKILKMLMKS